MGAGERATRHFGSQLLDKGGYMTNLGKNLDREESQRQKRRRATANHLRIPKPLGLMLWGLQKWKTFLKYAKEATIIGLIVAGISLLFAYLDGRKRDQEHRHIITELKSVTTSQRNVIEQIRTL